jgi:hypothetical protein
MFYREPNWELEHKFYAKHDFKFTAQEIQPDVMQVTVDKSSFTLPKELFFQIFYCIDTNGTSSFNPPKPQVLVDKEWYDALNLVFGKLHRDHTPYSGPLA